MILVIVNAAKCYKPSSLRIYTIYCVYLLQFIWYFLSTLFVQYAVLCVGIEDYSRESYTSIDHNFLGRKKAHVI